MLLIFALFPWSVYGEFSLLYFLAGTGAFAGVQILSYMVLYFRVENRASRVEKALPDALQLMSSNIKAGMTPFAAIQLAAKPEFGPLEKELKRATVVALGTGSFVGSLLHITTRIRSETLRRAMGLFVTSLKSGAQLARLLDETARDIRESKMLKQEMLANTKTYTMFIIFIIIIGAPVLLAITIHFVELTESMRAKMLAGELTGTLGISTAPSEITVEFLIKISYVILFVTSFLSSAMLGVITEGKEKYGAKFLPFMLIGTFVVFLIARTAVSSFFGYTF